MKVTNGQERVFTCSASEQVTIHITARKTIYTILSDFHLPVPNQNTENGNDSGTIVFTAANETVLTMEFHFSGETGGVYDLVFSPVEDADGIFRQRVDQKFGAKKRMRLFTFLVEE